MGPALVELLKVFILMVWNLSPNGTQLIASWWEIRAPRKEDEDVDEEAELWASIPMY